MYICIYIHVIISLYYADTNTKISAKSCQAIGLNLAPYPPTVHNCSSELSGYICKTS